MDHVDCIVIGAGIIGLAVTRCLARRNREVLLIEAGPGLGTGTSGRGSGVIHAGLYYPEGSLKARFCVEGRQTLYAFAADHGVPHRRTEKLVVATDEGDIPALQTLLARARANGVDDLSLLDGTEAKALEPSLTCVAALLSPSTGVIDVAALLLALRDEAETCGAVSAFSAPFLGAQRTRGGFMLDIGGAAPMRIGCRQLVNAAGHGAPDVARSIETLAPERIPRAYFAKGNYFKLDQPAPFSRLIYPLPVPGGVGTHLTVDMSGTAQFGPDVEWVDHLDYRVAPERAAQFYADVRRWWPALPDGTLRPSHAGIRPKISGPGETPRDFLIEAEAEHGLPGLVNLFGIESPGLTSSLAIGEHVAGLLAA